MCNDNTLPRGLSPRPANKLLVACSVCLRENAGRIEIQRGAAVLTKDSVVAGIVAAVVLTCQREEATHILLGFVPPTAVYLMIPLPLIDRIDEGSVWLKTTSEALEDLPVYQPDS